MQLRDKTVIFNVGLIAILRVVSCVRVCVCRWRRCADRFSWFRWLGYLFPPSLFCREYLEYVLRLIFRLRCLHGRGYYLEYVSFDDFFDVRRGGRFADNGSVCLGGWLLRGKPHVDASL